MTDSDLDPLSIPRPVSTPQIRRRRRRPSAVWIIPLVALFLGVALVLQYYRSQTTAKITFETAEGIVSGKTEVRCRSVRVGTVEAVSLADDLDHVVATVRIDLGSSHLLREDSHFWVVRPRLVSGSVSGLNTLLSGAYIELDPGVSTEKGSVFTGLEQPPATPQGVPGIHFTLIANEAGSLSVGAPIFFKGLEVGQIESRSLEPQTNKIAFGGFVRAPYDKLVYENTKFWNTSGIDLQVDANGIQLRTGTIESLFSGGVSFNSPADANYRIFPVNASRLLASDGSVYPLYDSFRATKDLDLENCPDYLLLFGDSIRGLKKDAPVEFRGIQVGKVTEISLDYRLLGEDPKASVPVFIRIDPLRLRLSDFPPIASTPSELYSAREKMMSNAVASGLRASLRTGNFLTGQLYVDLEFDEKGGSETVETVSRFKVLPTTSSGLARMQESLIAVLEKLENLPLEGTLESASTAFAEFAATATALKAAVAKIETTAEALTGLVAAEGTQKVPEELSGTLASLRQTLAGFDEQSMVYRDLTRTLTDLRDTLRSVTTLTDTVNRQPNTLIFGKPSQDVEPPRAKRP